MYLNYLNSFVSNLAVITTICQFLSGVLVCKQYVNNHTTAEATPLPFICGTFSSALWLLYGLLKHDDKIVLVNVIGSSLMFSYTIIFYIYTFKKSLVLKQSCCVIVLLLLVIAYIHTEEDNEVLVNRIGLLSCLLTLVTIAAPMSKLLYVLKVKNTECLPFPMIVMSFFVSALWFFYGIINADPYLQVPNFIGAVLSLSQLSLFIIYPTVPKVSISSKNLLDC